VFLIHERMLESFVFARDHFLNKQNGIMYPSRGTIHLAPVTDAYLWLDTQTKARWWQQTDFHGIDFSPLFPSAKSEYFGMPVVGPVPALTLLASNTTEAQFTMDFQTITVDEMQHFKIPFRWVMETTGIMHALAGWFDCDFIPKNVSQRTVLSTHPGLPLTHWQQVRFLLREPLAVNAGDVVVGEMVCQTNAMRSYDLKAVLWIEDAQPVSEELVVPQERPNSRRSGCWSLEDQTYNYNSQQQQQVQQQYQQQKDGSALDSTREWYGLYSGEN